MAVKWRVCVVLLTAVVLLSACDFPATPPPPNTSLQGSWRVVDPRIASAGIEIIWVFDGLMVAISDGSGEMISKSTFTVDDTQDPHHITKYISDIVDEVRPGIYAISDDELRLSAAVEGGSRPTSFEDGESVVLERIPLD